MVNTRLFNGPSESFDREQVPMIPKQHRSAFVTASLDIAVKRGGYLGQREIQLSLVISLINF